ncbi:MAG TPA: hypothetical protein PK711_09335 [Bacteroidales bacterium]|nr:hypothetical protein [Bacteroidales bacterium]HRZ20196.1 hypothetical protein [Bacteroidales bacterium]
MRNISLFLGKIIIYLLITLIGLLILHYLTCPVFEFAEPAPFSGRHLYNPYQNIDSMVWRKGNFQVQSKAWGGITDGRKNSNELIYDVYKQLGYDIIAISDYQKINTFGSAQPGYLPVYEHGWGIEKNHHVVIGARNVIWNDYPLFQNLHHKQHILNMLRESSELVYIAHPNFTKNYPAEEMKWLSGYTGIEVLNGFRRSVGHWDTALSAGRYVTILANDDAHDVSNPDEVGQFCTFIHSPGMISGEIIQSMKRGSCYGADIPRPLGETMEQKALRHERLPKLQGVRLKADTLFVEVDSTAAEFRFIGQGGIVRTRLANTSAAVYVIQPSDTYIRTEVAYPDGTTLYLNPVARYDENIPSNPPAFSVDQQTTWLRRGLTLSGLILLWFLYRKRRSS